MRTIFANILPAKIATVVVLLLLLCKVAIADRQHLVSNGEHIQDDRRVFKSPCGTKQQISRRSSKCMTPVFDLVEGRLPDVQNDEDIVNQCQLFAGVERCIRETSKDCLSGIHKAATGSMASSIRRYRLRECKTPETRSKFFGPTKCVREKGADTKRLYANLTSIAHTISELPIEPEQRMIHICCLLNKLESDTINLFEPACPKSVPTILALQRSITEDARTTLCVNPQCRGVLEKIPKNRKSKSGENILDPIMTIILDL